MENLISIGIALVIIWQTYLLITRQRKLKRDFDEFRENQHDVNIEFGSLQGEGIELVKKNYPDLELKDDHRTGIEDAKQ